VDSISLNRAGAYQEHAKTANKLKEIYLATNTHMEPFCAAMRS
jgi:hypothetical protein